MISAVGMNHVSETAERDRLTLAHRRIGLLFASAALIGLLVILLVDIGFLYTLKLLLLEADAADSWAGIALMAIGGVTILFAKIWLREHIATRSWFGRAMRWSLVFLCLGLGAVLAAGLYPSVAALSGDDALPPLPGLTLEGTAPTWVQELFENTLPHGAILFALGLIMYFVLSIASGAVLMNGIEAAWRAYAEAQIAAAASAACVEDLQELDAQRVQAAHERDTALSITEDEARLEAILAITATVEAPLLGWEVAAAHHRFLASDNAEGSLRKAMIMAEDIPAPLLDLDSAQVIETAEKLNAALAYDRLETLCRAVDGAGPIRLREGD